MMGKPDEGVTLFPTPSSLGHTDRLDARTAAANPFGYRSSSPSALAASKSSTRARRTDVFGPAERLPDARRRATRARRARRPRAARAHRPSSPRCAVESSRLPRPPRAAFFFTRAGVSVPSSARAVLSRAVCCCRHDGYPPPCNARARFAEMCAARIATLTRFGFESRRVAWPRRVARRARRRTVRALGRLHALRVRIPARGVATGVVAERKNRSRRGSWAHRRTGGKQASP